MSHNDKKSTPPVAPSTGAHSGDNLKTGNALQKGREEGLPKDTVAVYVKVTLGVLIVLNSILFILVIILIANVFGSGAEFKRPANCSHLTADVEVNTVPEVVQVASAPPSRGRQEGTGGAGKGAGAGGGSIAVVAHVYLDSSRLRQDKDNAGITRPPISPGKRPSSCELGYEVRHSGSVVYGVRFNKTTSRLQVAEPGFYYLYSQVVFDKVPARKPGQPFSDSLFHVLCSSERAMGREDRDQLKATETPNRARCETGECTVFHTSHLGGIVRLDAGDEVYVKVSDLNIVHGNSKGSFFGLHKI